MKFNPGDRLVLRKDASKCMAAEAGATAVVVGYPNPPWVNVMWDRGNKLCSTQKDGNYRDESFDLAPPLFTEPEASLEEIISFQEMCKDWDVAQR